MYFCYLDESGTSELGSGTSHFVLLGLSIPGISWKAKDIEITTVKKRYGLERQEIHAGWIARRYTEQEKIANFDTMSTSDRRKTVQDARDAFLVRKAALKGLSAIQGDRKNFRKTAAYIHLTFAERRQLLQDIADLVGGWSDCQLFAECTDKTTFDAVPHTPPFEEAFEQVVERYHRFLENKRSYGLLVQDQNETVVLRLTDLMRLFHQRGTRWTSQIRMLVETPLFVDSSLTSMVQMADVCAYATRRFCEHNETALFNLIFPRFNRVGSRAVGIRHYTNRGKSTGRRCNCQICASH